MSLSPLHQFAYWPRYVSRMLRFKVEYRGPLMDWAHGFDYGLGFKKLSSKVDKLAVPNTRYSLPVWKFSEEPPWNAANRLAEFPYPDVTWCIEMPDGKEIVDKLRPLPHGQQDIFRGDRVKVLVGPDKGKVGLVFSVLRMRRMVIVQGLNVELIKREGIVERRAMPLKIGAAAGEVTLLDPLDGEPCQPEWRYSEKGEWVRVSRRSGHLIPIPQSARILDDGTDPKAAKMGDKDTSESEATRVTYDPSSPDALLSFEDSLTVHLGLQDDLDNKDSEDNNKAQHLQHSSLPHLPSTAAYTVRRVRAPTFWY